MDFKSLLNKLDSMDAPEVTPKAPTIPAAVKLNEDAELRVLSGRSTYVAEAKKKAEEEKVDENAFTDKPKEKEMKVGDKKKSSTGGTIEKTKTGLKHTAGKKYGGEEADKEKVDEAEKKETTWTDMSGKKHPATQVKGGKYTGKEAEKEEKEKAKKDESVDVEKFKSKFAQMVAEAKKKGKPDFLDIDGDGDTKEPMKKAAADKKKAGGKKGVNPFAKKKEVKEAEEMKVGDKKKSSTGGTIEKTKTGVKHTAGKNYSGKEAEKEEKSKKDESIIKSKKVVAESVEQKLSFREMMKLVVESGGQQQIDPVDQELFAWASRVAKQKLGEGMKAEVYAGMVYERMGGVFNMYDVLSEDQE